MDKYKRIGYVSIRSSRPEPGGRAPFMEVALRATQRTNYTQAASRLTGPRWTTGSCVSRTGMPLGLVFKFLVGLLVKTTKNPDPFVEYDRIAGISAAPSERSVSQGQHGSVETQHSGQSDVEDDRILLSSCRHVGCECQLIDLTQP